MPSVTASKENPCADDLGKHYTSTPPTLINTLLQQGGNPAVGTLNRFSSFLTLTYKSYSAYSAVQSLCSLLVQQLSSEDIAANSAAQLALMPSAKADIRQFGSYLFFAVPLD
jgi:hypothetical protein